MTDKLRAILEEAEKISIPDHELLIVLRPGCDREDRFATFLKHSITNVPALAQTLLAVWEAGDETIREIITNGMKGT